jgi:hypothetical protein
LDETNYPRTKAAWKDLYYFCYLKGLSITSGFCIAKMHTADRVQQTENEKGAKQYMIIIYNIVEPNSHERHG